MAIGREKQKKYTDVVGLEIGDNVTHAVRMSRTKSGGLDVVAAMEMPGVHLPASPSEAVRNAGTLVVPHPVAAPYAAIAVSSPESIMRLVSLKKPPEEDSSAALNELFGATQLPNYRVGFVATRSDDPGEAAVPLANADGSRKPEDQAPIERQYMACALPNYVAENVAKILPEGRHPAPASLQLTSSARLAAFARGPVTRDKTSIVALLHVNDDFSTVSVFSKGTLVAYRQFPVGNAAVIARVAQEFGLAKDLAAEVLNENQLDCSTATGPVLQMLFRQVALSTDFVARREGGRLSSLFIFGVTTGVTHWLHVAESVLSIPIEQWMPFDDFSVRSRALSRVPNVPAESFTAAIGAAVALLEDL